MTDAAGICSVCGNHYDRAFTVTTASGEEHVFDSIECAASVVAPKCVNCGVQILGHGVQDEYHIYCCSHCAGQAGTTGTVDRVASGS